MSKSGLHLKPHKFYTPAPFTNEQRSRYLAYGVFSTPLKENISDSADKADSGSEEIIEKRMNSDMKSESNGEEKSLFTRLRNLFKRFFK